MVKGIASSTSNPRASYLNCVKKIISPCNYLARTIVVCTPEYRGENFKSFFNCFQTGARMAVVGGSCYTLNIIKAAMGVPCLISTAITGIGCCMIYWCRYFDDIDCHTIEWKTPENLNSKIEEFVKYERDVKRLIIKFGGEKPFIFTAEMVKKLRLINFDHIDMINCTIPKDLIPALSSSDFFYARIKCDYYVRFVKRKLEEV